jgi:hypothetical protein
MPEDLFAYIVCGAGKSTELRCLFGDASRKANGALFTACFTLNSVNEIHQPNLRCVFLEARAAIGARDRTT